MRSAIENSQNRPAVTSATPTAAEPMSLTRPICGSWSVVSRSASFSIAVLSNSTISTMTTAAISSMRRIELIAAVVMVLIVELLNTAIEKLADRLTTDHDPQIGRVKDMGSAAVGVALVTAGLFWLFSIAERMGAI